MKQHVLRGALIIALLTIIGPSFRIAQAASLAADPAPGGLDTTFAGFKFHEPLIGTTITKGMALLPSGKIVVLAASDKTNEFILFRYLSNGVIDFFNVYDKSGYIRFPNMFPPEALAVQSDGSMIVAGGAFQFARIDRYGYLDKSFGNNGRVKDPDAGNAVRSVLVQPDGKIVAAGMKINSHRDLAVVRYNADGTPDSTFGGGTGKVTINFRYDDEAYDLVLQDDGKLVVVGRDDAEFGFQDDDFAVVRLTANGALDKSFDYDGKLSTGFGGNEQADAVAVQSDGKIVVLGHNYSNKTVLARYYPDGKYDGDFGSGGQLTIPVDRLNDLVSLPDNGILLIGTHTSPDGDNKFALYRLKPNGALDTTFNYEGRVFLDFYYGNDQGRTVAVQPDGRILAAGTSGDHVMSARLWPDGTTDTGGQQTHGLASPPGYQPGQREFTYGMALDPNGNILATGRVYDPKGDFSDAFVTRFLPDGQPESTFGVNGSARISLGRHAVPRAIVLQPDGKIVVAGYSAFNREYTIMDFLVIRFNPDGKPDPTFGLNGTLLVDFAGGADGAAALALAPDGKIVVAGMAWNGVSYDWGIVRLTTTGQPDPTFGNGGKYTSGLGLGDSLNAVAIQPDGKILLAGNINKNFAVARLQPNGQIDLRFGVNGFAINDLGGTDTINALRLASNGWIYAAGYRNQNGNADMALAQYTPNGALASCAAGTTCSNWPNGTFFLDAGINDYAYALDLRDDNQLVAAGCSNQHFAGVQVPTDRPPTPLAFNTDFVGYPDCANAVKFIGSKIVMVGDQNSPPFSNDTNIALARFQTTAYQTVSTALSPADERTTEDTVVPTPPLAPADEPTAQDTAVPTPPRDEVISDTVTLSTTVSSGLVRP